MDSVILYLHPVMRCCSCPIRRKQLLRLSTGKPFLVRDVTRNGLLAFSTRREDVGLVSSSIRTNEDEDNSREMPPMSRKEKDRLARQEEIISLFRKIQSSISKGEKAGSEDDIPEDDKEKPAAESVLEIMRRSRNKAKNKIQANQANREKTKFNAVRKMRISPPKMDKEVQPIPILEVPRLPSNFVKRSPIPFPSAPRGRANVPDEGNGFGLQKLNGLKLDELKELAKSRGLKGYSKLKKMELVQLLISQP
ncbi:hypothetical protein MLD38_016718 [Melastoma candidum]|uniref:Uncharacterized protein n=1 Tax=Melastoma candidum TaxID=119954 RepID=A0ACB9QNB9_9MYRT|nr:hypothetical protein MLD38_016718 [Melastoma candidum]